MSLSPRQERLYGDRFDVWREGAYGSDGCSLALSGVRCWAQNTPNYDQTRFAIGLVKEDNIFTSDVIHMEIETDVRAGDHLRVTLASGAVRWYTTAGEVRKKPFRANAQECYVLPSVAPPGYAS